MATRTKQILFSTLLILVAACYAWSKRSVNIQIGSVNFKFPAQAVVSSSRTTNGLDRNNGAFVVLPNGPYYGEWGLLLQSSKDRRGDGMPSGFKEALATSSQVFSRTSFGWLVCDSNCGQESWFFYRLPNQADSTYSVRTIVCFDTDTCKLFLSYKDVDIQVSMERQKVGQASMVIMQVQALLDKYNFTSEDGVYRN